MKKIKLLVFIVVCAQTLSAQVTRDSSRKITPVMKSNQVTSTRTIPATRAVNIRKDVAGLKIQATQLSDSLAATKYEIDLLISTMKNDLDSMSEMGEAESLRLQMAMDRLSKMMNTLSNLLKKMSDTAQSITQNIK